MKRWLRILITLAIGFGIAMLLMTVAIYFGYSHAYVDGGVSYTVRLFGLGIYELTQVGDRYSGASVGTNMGVVCGICMTAALVLEELIWVKRRRKCRTGNEKRNRLRLLESYSILRRPSFM